jgi:hypothetical protein
MNENNNDVTPDQTGSSGAGVGRTRTRNRRGGRGGMNGLHRQYNHQKVSFDGREPTLKGHVYDLLDDKNSEQYVKTTKEISNWVGREYTKYTGELCEAVKTLILTSPTSPVDPPANDPMAFERWKLALKKFNDTEEAHNDFRARLFNVVMGQCTPALEDRVKSHAQWANIQQDGLELLRVIKTITYTFEDRRYLGDALLDVKEEFYRMHQGKHESLQKYYERFMNQVDVMNEVGVSVVDEAMCADVARANGRPGAPNDDDRAEALERTLAMRFIRGGNIRFKTYLTELRHSALNGVTNYPATLTLAYNIMQRREDPGPPTYDNTEAIAFVTAGRDGRTFRDVKCFSCSKKGHYATQCPENDAPEANEGIVFANTSNRKCVPANWVLLDSEANVDLFCNQRMLKNIRRVNKSMTVHCNAGSRVTNMMGDLPGYPYPVWYSPHAIANILSLSNVSNVPRWWVNYDSSNGHGFAVRKEDGSTVRFGRSSGRDGPAGLYRAVLGNKGLHGVTLVNTVAKNKSNFTKEEVNRAELARTFQKIVGRPSTKDLIRYVTRNQLPNCPITKEDIVNAEIIFGPDVGSLKGKTTRHGPSKVRVAQSMLPDDVFERNREVTLCADIMYINGTPFFVSVSRKIKFGTIQELTSRSNDNVLTAIDRVLATYRGGGFTVRYMLMDGEFESLRAALASESRRVTLNITSNDEHVGEIERYNRTIKERVRSIFNSLPFTRMPRRMIIEMAKSAVFWRNAFPADDGISDEMSPRAIVTGNTLDYRRHCQYEFGEYVQTHEEHDNSMNSRTIGALALRPTGNVQGG